MSEFDKVRKPLESDVQSDILDLLHMRGWFAQKVEFKGRRGCPDVVAVKRSRTIWFEAKRDEDETARLQQQMVHREMRSAGAEVYSDVTLEDVRRIIK